MTTAAELREALDWFKEEMVPSRFEQFTVQLLLPIADAARTIALPILEADPELVERVAKVLFEWLNPRFRWDELDADDQREYIEIDGRDFIRRVLAAISTPTPVEAEDG